MGVTQFDCMHIISVDQADLIDLDVGLGNIASNDFSLRPLAVENYDTTLPQGDLSYYANIVVPIGENVDPYTLRRKEVCFAGKEICFF